MADITPLMWAYKYSREIARRMSIFRGEVPSRHPAFSKDSKAAVIDYADGPISMDAERIVYTEEDDKILENHIREQG